MIGIIPDIHFRDHLPYSDYIPNGRNAEREKVFDFIVEKLKECEKIVFLGDILHNRTSPPQVVKELIKFIERFAEQELFIIRGNHDVLSDGRTSFDFLSEITNKKWHIITSQAESFGNLSFLPFISNAELEVKDIKDAVVKILKMLKPGDILFHHYSVSGMWTNSGFAVNDFKEVILPRDKLEKKYRLIFSGHVHNPQVIGRTIVAGSVFTDTVDETEKFIWKINETDFTYEKIALPVRPIHKIENPESAELEKLPKNSIVKTVLTKKYSDEEIKELKKKLSKFDAYILLEQIPHERKKLHYAEGESILEWDIEKLLQIYAKEKNTSFALLKKGYDLIRI